MKHYDYLVVGAGLYGAVFAYEAKKRGMARSDSTPPVGRRFAGREPNGSLPNSCSGVAERK